MNVSVGTSTDNYSNYAAQATGSTQNASAAKVTDSKGKEPHKDAGVVYEKNDVSNKATYSINKMSAEDRAALVQQLKQDQVNRQMQLSDLVSQMLSKQAGASDLASLFSPENLKNVSAADIAQAREDISEDGYWGVKQTSQRMFDFASALAGDDVDKMKEMQEAMQKGYEAAAKAWGKELPDISKQTLDAANKLFEDYYRSKEQVEA